MAFLALIATGLRISLSIYCTLGINLQETSQRHAMAQGKLNTENVAQHRCSNASREKYRPIPGFVPCCATIRELSRTKEADV